MSTYQTIPGFDATVQVGLHAIEVSTCRVVPTAGSAVYLDMGPLTLSLSVDQSLALVAELTRAVEHFRAATAAAGGAQ